MRNATVSVVIPVLNEAENLRHVLPRIPSDVYEVIVVDGGSTDRSIEVALLMLPGVRVVHQQGRGKGAALRAGFEAATGDIIVHLDADGSTDPAEIPSFVGCLLAGADYAKGTRFIQGAASTDITPLRRFGNMGFVTLANILFGTQFSDITYGYNAFWRHHREKLALEIDGWAHEIVGNIRATRHGLRVVEVASRETPRLNGTSKLSTFSAGWTILKAILAERLRKVPAFSDAPVVPAQGMTGVSASHFDQRRMTQPIQVRLMDAHVMQEITVTAIPIVTDGMLEPTPSLASDLLGQRAPGAAAALHRLNPDQALSVMDSVAVAAPQVAINVEPEYETALDQSAPSTLALS
jgi:glycosyl transferase family 2